MMTPKETQDTWINAVKSCGQSLIDNAESIAGDFDYQTETHINIALKPEEITEISVTHQYIPKDIRDKDKLTTTRSKARTEWKAV